MAFSESLDPKPLTLSQMPLSLQTLNPKPETLQPGHDRGNVVGAGVAAAAGAAVRGQDGTNSIRRAFVHDDFVDDCHDGFLEVTFIMMATMLVELVMMMMMMVAITMASVKYMVTGLLDIMCIIMAVACFSSYVTCRGVVCRVSWSQYTQPCDSCT